MIPSDHHMMMITFTDLDDTSSVVQTLLQGGTNPDIMNDVS